MKTTLKLALLVTASALALTACDGGSNNSPPAAGGPTALEDNFGAAFGVLYRASANTDPADPGANSVIPVSFTTDPIPVP